MEQMEQPEEACLSLCRGKFLELLKEGRWEYVRRVNASGAVMIVAVTKEGELLLVEEYRVPLHARTVGLPAGISGDEGEESTLQSARRELEEETGYRAKVLERRASIFTGPGFTDEVIHLYLARDLYKTSANPDDDEFLEVGAYAPGDIRNMVSEGMICDAKTISGLYLLQAEK